MLSGTCESSNRLRFAVKQSGFTGPLGGPGKIGGRSKGVGKGHGYRNKSTVFAVLERGGDVRSMPMGSITASGLGKALREHVDPASRLMTDSNNSYTYPGKEYASHEKVDHSKEEYVATSRRTPSRLTSHS